MSSLSSSSSSSSLDSLDSFDATSYFSSLARRRQQKKMSITQTYYLAHTARRKLTREASRADHDLRLLVGHANLLDSLMLDLADAEQEQERWFNQTVNGVSKSSPSPSSPLADTRHIQWADAIVEDPEDDWDPEDLSDADSDLSDDSDFDEDDFAEERFAVTTPIRRPTQSPVPFVTEREVPGDYDDGYSDSESEFEYDDAEDLKHLTLTRSPSRQSPPPDLSSDSDEESEDDTMPPSPPQQTLDTFADDEKHPQSTAIPLDADQGLFDQRYYAASQSQDAIIEAY